jgi:hypothetical protein
MGEKLKTEDAKKYQIVSRILGILMRIGNVCCWIGAVAVACTAIACSIIVPNIKIDRDAKEISAFDKSYSYDFREKEIEIGEGDEKIVIKDNEINISGLIIAGSKDTIKAYLKIKNRNLILNKYITTKIELENEGKLGFNEAIDKSMINDNL